MEKEEFRNIPGYEGVYQVSNLGNVKSLSREKVTGKLRYNTKEIILKPGKRGKKKLYFFVRFYDKKMFSVHQLVAICFLNHKVDGHKLVVDHINNNSLDNRLENLQIITSRENRTKDLIKYKSKYIGVYFCKCTNKFRARIIIDNKNVCLGRYTTELEAHLAYKNKLKQII